MTEYRRALRAGRLPNDVDVDEWARWLGGSQTAVGLAALCGLPLVVFGLFISLGSESPHRWLPVAMFTLVFGTGAVVLLQRRAGIKALTAAMKRRRASISATGTSRGASSNRASTMLMKDSVFEMSLAGRLVSGQLVGCTRAARAVGAGGRPAGDPPDVGVSRGVVPRA
jgi:hypothetical protein